jgi:excisionase family DNA binding protein
MLDVVEAAKLLGVPRRTLDLWRYVGRGPAFYKVGGRVRYKKEDIEAWLETRKVS